MQERVVHLNVPYCTVLKLFVLPHCLPLLSSNCFFTQCGPFLPNCSACQSYLETVIAVGEAYYTKQAWSQYAYFLLFITCVWRLSITGIARKIFQDGCCGWFTWERRVPVLFLSPKCSTKGTVSRGFEPPNHTSAAPLLSVMSPITLRRNCMTRAFPKALLVSV